MASVLAAQSEEFDERNLFLLLALGLLSFGERLDALIRDYAPRPCTRETAAPAENDPLLYLLLGAVKVSNSVRDELAAAATAPPSRVKTASRAAASMRAPREGLLR